MKIRSGFVSNSSSSSFFVTCEDKQRLLDLVTDIDSVDFMGDDESSVELSEAVLKETQFDVYYPSITTEILDKIEEGFLVFEIEIERRNSERRDILHDADVEIIHVEYN